jgi:hypothetical protein
MLLGVGGIAGSGAPEKAFDGLYFALAKGIVFCIAEMFIVSSGEVINSECTVTILDNFNEIDLFNELGLGPASVFVYRQGNMVIRGWTGERKTIC